MNRRQKKKLFSSMYNDFSSLNLERRKLPKGWRRDKGGVIVAPDNCFIAQLREFSHPDRIRVLGHNPYPLLDIKIFSLNGI